MALPGPFADQPVVLPDDANHVVRPPVELAEAPPPAMSAADAGVDVVAIEPIAAPAPPPEAIIRPEAPENLRPGP